MAEDDTVPIFDQLRDLFITLLRNNPVEADIVEQCVDVNFVGRLEGIEFDFTGVESNWEEIIDMLVTVVMTNNDDEVIVRIENGEISLKNVITVLGFAMEKILDKTVQSSIFALLAARIYLLLCCLKPAEHFGICHPSLFYRAIACYRGVCTLKNLRGDLPISKSKKKAKAKNAAAAASTTFFSTTAPNNTQFPADSNDDASPQLLNFMSDTLLHSLEQLYIYFQLDNIGTKNKVFSSLVDLIRLISRFDYSSSTRTLPVESYREFKLLKQFSDRCFALAHLALAEKHNREDMVLSMFCVPRLTFKNFDKIFMRGNLPQSVIQMANVMVKFVKDRFEGAEMRDMIYLKRLAENVCHRCLAEIKDHRLKSLEIAIQFAKMLPEVLLRVVNYGYLQTQRCRLIAVDLVSLLMEHFDVASFPQGVPQNVEVDYEFGSIVEAVEYEDKYFHQNNPSFKKNWDNFLYFTGDESFIPRDNMIQLLIRASMDKSAPVRSRGLIGILPFLKNKEGYAKLTEQTKIILEHSRINVIKILSEVNQHDEKNARDTPVLSQGTQETRPDTPVPADVHQAAQEEAQYLTKVSIAPLVDLIIQRCNDKNALTRNHTVPVIEALLSVEPNVVYQKALLQKLQELCRDPKPTVRQNAAEAMTSIVRDEEVFKQAWLHTVLPMVNDREESVEKSCRKMFFDKIVLPIIADDGSDSLSWNMMIEIAKTSEFTRAFRRCFQQTAREKDYKRILCQLADVLYGAVKVDTVASSAWMLLDYLADAIEIDPAPAVHAWVASDELSGAVDPSIRIVSDPKELISILNIILKRREKLSEEQRLVLRDNISLRFVEFRLHESVIFEAIITFVGVTSVGANAQELLNLHSFFSEIIDKVCFKELKIAPEEDIHMPMAERKKRICRRLLTMAQCALHSPKSTTVEMVELLIHILSVEAPSLDENTTRLFSRPQTRIGLPASQDDAEISKLQRLPFKEITGDISASAVLALGKFLLANDDLARDFLEKLAVVHGTSVHASVRNNVIYVLGDCYLRYTSKMDSIQPSFLHGLRDRVDFVRYHCLILTTELLRSQYMKMSALVLARLLPLYLDPEPAIRDALTGETLAVIEDQFPNVYVENFVTCMFLFNKVGFGAYKEIDRFEMPENPICFLNHDFSGPSRKKHRMELYKFMLKKLDSSKRFALIKQISNTIFGNVVEGKISFETIEAKQLILDGFEILECPEARITFEEGQRDGDDEEAEIATEEIQNLARATIRAAFCAAFVKIIMPLVMAMARFLALNKSPLQKEFRNCLAVIAETYPDQLHVLFRDSVQLKTEIEAELRRRKKDARKSRMAKNRALVNNIEKAAAAAVIAAEAHNEAVDKENNPPANDEPAVKTEPNATQIVKTEPMEVAQVLDGNKTIDVTMDEAAGEKTFIAEPPLVEVKVEVPSTQPPSEEQPVEEEIVNKTAVQEAADDEVFDSVHTAVELEVSAPVTPVSVRPSASRQSTMSAPSSTQENEEQQEEIPAPNNSRRSQSMVTPPRKEQSQTIVCETTPKQPSPKRPRLSLNRLQAIRTEEAAAKNFALIRSPKLDAPIPKLSARVGVSSKPTAVIAPSISSNDEVVGGRLHSTPVKDSNMMDFTFGLSNISTIEGSPRGRNVTLRTRTRSGTKRSK